MPTAMPAQAVVLPYRSTRTAPPRCSTVAQELHTRFMPIHHPLHTAPPIPSHPAHSHLTCSHTRARARNTAASLPSCATIRVLQRGSGLE